MSWILHGQRKEQAFHDKAWVRAELPPWDLLWESLSANARKEYLKLSKTAPVPVPRKGPLFSVWKVPAPLVEEWKAAGLVETVERMKGKTEACVTEKAHHFTVRLRAMERYSLLKPGVQVDNVSRYAEFAFNHFRLIQELLKVLEKALSLSLHISPLELMTTFVCKRRWPDWVKEFLEDSLAGTILDAIRGAGGTIFKADLGKLIPRSSQNRLQEMVDKLIHHLALFEDIDRDTGRIQLGLLPLVLADLNQPRQPPTRLIPTVPVAVAPEPGILMSDLRATLLELAGGRARRKLGGGLYAKEEARFITGLEEVAESVQISHPEPERRLEVAFRLAQKLELVNTAEGPGDSLFVDLTKKGRNWLQLSPEQQYAPLYEANRNSLGGNRTYFYSCDSAFLGAQIVSFKRTGKKQPSPFLSQRKPEEFFPFRLAVLRAFQQLPAERFIPLSQFSDYISDPKYNPLYLGLDLKAVEVFQNQRIVAPLEEVYEELGKHLVQRVALQLAEVGAVQLGVGTQEGVLICRRPRLEFYFDEKAIVEEASAPDTRVIVGPDFSVIVIGLSHAPTAVLATFSERAGGKTSPGSATFRLTRESIIRGIASGLTAEEIVQRLEKLSGRPLPQNVHAQINTWGGKVRNIEAQVGLLIRCPDRETADRVLAVLGKKADRAGDTMVVVDTKNPLTPGQRKKLGEEGLLLRDF